MPLYLGLMSGTSQDGLDGVVLDMTAAGARVVHHRHSAFDTGFRARLSALNDIGADELHRAALAANELAQRAADLVAALLADAGLQASDVRAIGSHGITLRHRPQRSEGSGYTVQIDNPALLAELTGIDVVADFRRRDVAAGGQGAPLVPAFHAAVFGQPGLHIAVLNLGGFANLTLLGADGAVRGFDCGPANALLDAWAHHHLRTPCDDQGAWAASGQVHAGLLARMQADSYFALKPPKSTGRDHFDMPWLRRHLDRAQAAQAGVVVKPADVAATLVELTVWSVGRDLMTHAPQTVRLHTCGGGVFNTHMMQSLASRLHPVVVETTTVAGIDPQHVEAAAFAWLAHAHLERVPGNRHTVTGAAGPRVLGALYPA